MNRARFEAFVRKATEGLPVEFRAALEDLSIIVQDAPTEEQIAHWGLDPEDADLLGFYDGVPLTERPSDGGDGGRDAVYVFQRAHEEEFPREADLIREIHRTVIHEIGHHFGLDDDRIDELGFA